MAKGRTNNIEAELAKLEAIKSSPSTPEAIVELTKALTGKSNLVAAKAAGIVAASRVSSLEPLLVRAFDRFVPPDADKGCLAKLAIVKALVALESRAEAMYLIGARLTQPEAAWGKPVDTAVELRCECCNALVNMNSSDAMVPLTHLLADENEPARLTAVRALEASGRDEAAPLLRVKMLIGGGVPSV